MKSRAKASIYLDKRNPLSDQSFPVTLRIYFERQAKFFVMKGNTPGYKGFTEEYFNKIYAQKSSAEFKKLNGELLEVELAAQKVIDSMDYFSFDLFKEKFFGKNEEIHNDVLWYLQNHIDVSKSIHKYGTAMAVNSTLKHLKGFVKKKTLLFQEVTPAFLQKFEKYMQTETGIKSVNTIGINMRNMRIMFNKAMADKVVGIEYYPFGKGKYQIPKLTKKTLKALTKDEVKLIDSYQTEDKTRQWVRDMWIFSYLSNGMNIADLVHIKHSDIKGDEFVFIRKKTEDTAKSNLKAITVAIQPRMVEIMERWGNPPEMKYLYPIIDENMSETTIDIKIRNLNSLITKIIKKIAKELEISKHKEISAVYARHSFATILRNSGAGIEYISEALGHNNTTTTMHYLAKFDSATVKKWSVELL